MRRILALLSAAFALTAVAAEQPYPLRPVRLLVTAPPGGTVDLVARVVGPRLAEQMGQPFIVDNRPGAGGVIAAELIAKAAPDGYTLGVVYTSFTTNAVLRKNPPYDPVKDYAPLSLVMWSPLVLVAHPGLGVNSARDLIALSKSKQLHYASAGNGTGGHMCGELFRSLAGIRAVHVPYKGAALGTNDVVAGQVQFTFVGPVTVLSQPADIRQKLGGEGSEIVAGTPDAFAAFLRGDVDKWRRVVRSANITVD